MALKINIEDSNGQTFGYWFIEQYVQSIRTERMDVTIIGYKSKATRDAGKTGIEKHVIIEGAAWQKNMTLSEIEDAVLKSPEFSGSILSA